MIECTDQNVWYIKKHRKNGKFKRCFRAFIIIIFVILSYLYYHNITCENIFNICLMSARSSCTESVNLAILSTLNDSVMYTDLISVEKNTNGDITLMSTNALKINSISKQISNKTLQYVKLKFNDGIKIPIMAFSGLTLLSGYGSEVNFKTIHATNVTCEFDSTFKSVGINQTLHSIYVNVITEININMPFNTKTSINITPILICEAVLVGKVPDIYLNQPLFK